MTARELALLGFRPPAIDDLAVNEYGDRAYGTPASTIWADAYERARARLENPRVLPPGMSFDGNTGNIDSPERVTEEIFQPVQEALHPLQAMEERPKPLTDLDRSLIESRRADIALNRDKEARIAFNDEAQRRLAERAALEEFNARSAKTSLELSKGKQAAMKFQLQTSIKAAEDALVKARKNGDPDAEQAALEQLAALEDELAGAPRRRITAPAMSAPAMPTPVARPVAPVAPGVNIDQIRAEAMQALKFKDPAQVRARFRQLTGQDL